MILPLPPPSHSFYDFSSFNHVQGTVEVIESAGAAAIAVPAQPDMETSHQIEADVPSGVTIAIKEVDPDSVAETPDEKGDAPESNKGRYFIDI